MARPRKAKNHSYSALPNLRNIRCLKVQLKARSGGHLLFPNYFCVWDTSGEERMKVIMPKRSIEREFLILDLIFHCLGRKVTLILLIEIGMRGEAV
jgi:hypothetical protein